MTNRRDLLKAGAASLATLSAPSLVLAQAAPARARTLRAVMHSDLRVFDPIWTTANITGYHGAMIYDTLFAVDGNFAPQPQMVSKWAVSDDRKTYTFELRDGLSFSDGQAVTAADCVASIRRWSVRDGFGQHLFRRVADTPVVDDKTFRIVLSEPYGLVIQALAKLDPSLCFIMKKKDAETDPNTQVKDALGSGPFTLNRDETRAGNRYVYDKNAGYRPRMEAASGLAGGKVVNLDRVIFENIADQQSALGALQNGEIDFYEVPPQDLLDGLEADPNTQVKDALGSGPFTLNRDETRAGNRYVYDKSAGYRPRMEAASGLAGGKVVNLDRVIFENIADQQSALGALQNGEIDFYEVPPQDLLDGLEADPNIVVQGLNKTGHMGMMSACLTRCSIARRASTLSNGGCRWLSRIQPMWPVLLRPCTTMFGSASRPSSRSCGGTS